MGFAEFSPGYSIKALHYKNGKLHCEDGPAVEYDSPDFWQVWIEGKFMFSFSSQSNDYIALREAVKNPTKKNEAECRLFERLEALRKELSIARNGHYLGVEALGCQSCLDEYDFYLEQGFSHGCGYWVSWFAILAVSLFTFILWGARWAW